MANKVASQKAPSKRGRCARSNEELRRMVREACEEEFQAFTGRPWSEVSERVDRYQRTRIREIEQEARLIHGRLRRAIKAAIDFAEREDLWGQKGLLPHGGAGVASHAAHTLRVQARRVLKPVLQSFLFGTFGHRDGQTVWLERRWPTLHEGRATLALVLDQFNIFGLPPNPSGQSRFFTAREMAVISLLAGNWPALGGTTILTPAEVIKRESILMRDNLERWGWDARRGQGERVFRGDPKPKPSRSRKRKDL